MKLRLTYRHLDLLLIWLGALLLYLPFLGDCALFDWDEVNFAECAREMLVSGNYSQVQLNYQVFWEKPPLFIWMQALSMKVFGINEFAARFPNAMCALATLSSLYVIGNRHHSRKFAWSWLALYACSLLPHFYFRTGIIDPWFNLFIFLALYQFFLISTGSGYMRAFLAGLFLGAAVLTKGPVALVVSGLSIVAYLVWIKQLRLFFTLKFWIFALSTLFFSASWFIAEWLNGNGHIIEAFITYQIRLFQTQDAGHGGSKFYHVIVLLFGTFPSSILFILNYRNSAALNEKERRFRRLMLVLFWTVLLIFTLVKTKIVHYSSLCYFPITYVAALAVLNFQTLTYRRAARVLFWTVGLLIGCASLAAGAIKWLVPALQKYQVIKDEFAAANLNAPVNWSGIELLLPIFFVSGLLLLHKALVKKQLQMLFTGMVLNMAFIMWFIYRIIPGIELYTQAAPISFYKACAGSDCNIETHSFKSYAYLFYSQRKPQDYTDPHQLRFIESQLNLMETEGHSRLTSYATANALWMEHGQIQRPTYLVVKSNNEQDLQKLPELKRLYAKNGFVFYVRIPNKPAK